MNRRDFLRRIAGLGGLSTATVGVGVWLRGRSRPPEETVKFTPAERVIVPPDPNFPELVIVRGENPGQLVRRAVAELGGISRFIAPGDVVLIKPNIAWDRTPEQAANTNPEAVGEMVRLCREAGAREVIVTDISCNDPRRCYRRSGIADAATDAGATIIMPDNKKFKQTNIGGEVLTVWPVFEPFLLANKVINMPVAKHHSLTGVTLGMKNWYGIIGGRRSQLHQSIHKSIVDLASFMNPTITVLDAYRVLLRNGPTGGNLSDVAIEKTVIAGTDPVAVDAYAAAAFWSLDPGRLPFLQMAEERGLGRADLQKVRQRTVEI